jgi:hypothetical protein
VCVNCMIMVSAQKRISRGFYFIFGVVYTKLVSTFSMFVRDKIVFRVCVVVCLLVELDLTLLIVDSWRVFLRFLF